MDIFLFFCVYGTVLHSFLSTTPSTRNERSLLTVDLLTMKSIGKNTATANNSGTTSWVDSKGVISLWLN